MRQLEEWMEGIDETLKLMIERSMASEQKSAQQKQVEQSGQQVEISELQNALAGLQSKLSAVEEHVKATHKAVAEANRQSPKVERHFRFQLFPEFKTEHYYKLIFGRVIPYLLLTFAIAKASAFGLHWVDRHEALKQREIETNINARAWEDLYQHAKPKERRVLDRLWQHNAEQVK